jgi:hypothetical protein
MAAQIFPYMKEIQPYSIFVDGQWKTAQYLYILNEYNYVAQKKSNFTWFLYDKDINSRAENQLSKGIIFIDSQNWNSYESLGAWQYTCNQLGLTAL